MTEIVTAAMLLVAGDNTAVLRATAAVFELFATGTVSFKTSFESGLCNEVYPSEYSVSHAGVIVVFVITAEVHPSPK